MIWFGLVDTHKQSGTDAADREHVNESQQHSDVSVPTVHSTLDIDRTIYIPRYRYSTSYAQWSVAAHPPSLPL